MGAVKGFWQDVDNGSIYAVESTTFGEIIGGAGPLDPENLGDLDDYEYTPRINQWLKAAFAEGKLRSFKPEPGQPSG